MSGEEKLERIEVALGRIQQQLDNQVVVNASLRTSTEELKNSTVELRATAEAILEVVQIHQQNFEVLTARQLQTETRLEEYQRTTSAALDRIGAVLDYLVRQQGNV